MKLVESSAFLNSQPGSMTVARTRIKFCGLTHVADVAAAVGAGADALGFNLFEGSRRFVSPDSLEVLTRAVPAFVVRVGVLVNPDRALVSAVLSHLELLQFHGDETAEFCASFGRPYMKAVRVASTSDALPLARMYPDARAILIDKLSVKQGEGVVYGGSGETMTWERVVSKTPMVLAGGLDPDNVGAAISTVRPFAVDVASGIEHKDETAGRKSTEAMNDFIAAVRQADMEN